MEVGRRLFGGGVVTCLWADTEEATKDLKNQLKEEKW